MTSQVKEWETGSGWDQVSQFPYSQGRWCWYNKSVLSSAIESVDERAANFTATMKIFYLSKGILWIPFTDEKRSSVDNLIELHREFPCEDAKLEYAKLQLSSSKCQYILVSHVITQTAFSGILKWCLTYQEQNLIPLFCNGPQKNSRLGSFSHTFAFFFFSIKPSYRNGPSHPESTSKASRTSHPASTLTFIPYPAKMSVPKILKNFYQFFPSTFKALSLKLWLLAIQVRWFYFY